MENETDPMDRPAPPGLDFHAVFAAAPAQLMIMDLEFNILYANRAYLKTTMRSLSELQGRYIFDAFPEMPKRMALFKRAFERAAEGEENVLTTEPFSVLMPDGGRKEIVWTCTQVPLPGPDGKIAFVMQKALDVTEKYHTDRHAEALLQELDHRGKNALATVQAIARRSLVDSKTMKEARDDFLGRLKAMSQMHGLLIRQSWEGTDMLSMLAVALKPFGYAEENAGPFTLAGPQLAISARQAQSLSMAIHELATNAAKYGALSVESGKVAVSWSANGDGFELLWREKGGPPVTAPTRRGFGTTLLADVLASEIGGAVALDYPEEGVSCRIAGKLDGEAA